MLSDLSSSTQNSSAPSIDLAAAGGDPSLSSNDPTVNNGNSNQTVNNDLTVNHDLRINPNSSDKSRTIKICRQPKGTMNEVALNLKKFKAQALNYADAEFCKLKKQAADIGLTKVTCGTYDNVMRDAQEKYLIPESITLNKRTVES